MLSRIAESLFWIGRYIERSDGTAGAGVPAKTSFIVLLVTVRVRERQPEL